MESSSDLILNSHMQTQAVHAGFESSDDIVQPIHVSTTFLRQQHDTLGGYTRTGNPNRTTLERKIATLEKGADAVAFSSGMASINALFEAILTPGSQIIYPDDCYHGARSLLKNIFQKKDIIATEVDMNDVKNIEAVITPKTKLIWIETPSNPQLKVADIKAIADLGKRKNILTACDSTFGTPVLQRPLDLGVDFVMHSSTKFFSGHSDVLGGVLIAREKNDTLNAIRLYQGVAGPVPSPFDCWLLNRSLATLTLRVGTQSANAMAIATYLSRHSKIERVFYPGLTSHPNHEVAKKQMTGGFGAVLSACVKGGRAEALDLCKKLQIIKHATSLGGVETLIEHRRSAEGAMALSPDNLLRISVGIEYVDDLIKDFERALK
jgi:cystathionine gamma-synthase